MNEIDKVRLDRFIIDCENAGLSQKQIEDAKKSAQMFISLGVAIPTGVIIRNIKGGGQ